MTSCTSCPAGMAPLAAMLDLWIPCFEPSWLCAGWAPCWRSLFPSSIFYVTASDKCLLMNIRNPSSIRLLMQRQLTGTLFMQAHRSQAPVVPAQCTCKDAALCMQILWKITGAKLVYRAIGVDVQGAEWDFNGCTPCGRHGSASAPGCTLSHPC